MTILITGGRGKTAIRLATILSSDPKTTPVLVASRTSSTSSSHPSVLFDWHTPSTWAALFAQPHAISGVYLVPPSGTLELSCMISFIELAISHSVKRFVLLSSTAVDENSPFFTGPVHAYLAKLGAEKAVEWAVVQASWFMENFSEMQHQPTIQSSSAIYSATHPGRVAFVSAHDIAAVAAGALTQTAPPNRAFVVTGPECLSYDDVAAIFSDVLGRKIRHVRSSETEMAERFEAAGMDGTYASMLAGLDARIASGEMESLSQDVEEVTGKRPLGVREFVERNKAVWEEK